MKETLEVKYRNLSAHQQMSGSKNYGIFTCLLYTSDAADECVNV